ncbi:leucine-rich repeat protein 1-like [Macrobrachium rosenbergii]|uniref:leucine-rich repeat protein 1-like n=1 Tax=Macrobrachium rosenbergii TaxID=79674 RepID=UPI0034D7512C
MRINCEVQVSNRSAGSVSKKCCRSSLGLGRLPDSKAEVSSLFIHLCTVQNKQGTKYKVAGNIEGVFTKFVAEGKFTIRFKEPPHDLCVKADVVLAKSFLSTLKMALQNKEINKMHLSNLAPAKQSQLEKPKTKLVILNKKDYPITTAFPYSLENLHVNNVDLNRVENRIIGLKRLKTLDLSHNVIRKLPMAMNRMQSLTELYLSHNGLKEIDHRVFTGRLSRTLRRLDLSNNELELLPVTLKYLKGLVNLNVSSNKLRYLPLSFDRLQALKFLSASHNKLEVLPATLVHLQLEELDVFGNPFVDGDNRERLNLVAASKSQGRFPRLKEIAALSCMRNGLRPTAADIPSTLADYLYSWLKCLCGGFCYESHTLAYVSLDVRKISHSISVSDSNHVVAVATLCSKRCCDRYCKR